MKSAAAAVLMPLLIFCCVHRSSDSRCFSVDQTTPNIAHFHCGSGYPSNTWFLGPTRVYRPNGISIGSAVFAGLTNVTNRHTDRQTMLLRLYPHLVIAAMRPKKLHSLKRSIKTRLHHTAKTAKITKVILLNSTYVVLFSLLSAP